MVSAIGIVPVAFDLRWSDQNVLPVFPAPRVDVAADVLDLGRIAIRIVAAASGRASTNITRAKGPYKKPGAVFRPGFSHSFLRLPTCSRVLLQSLLTASCTPSDIEDCLDWRIFLCLYRVPSFELQRLVNYR